MRWSNFRWRKYNRQTNVYDGCIYDWVSHCECSKLACELDMFDDCDEGLDDDGFIDRLNQYVYDNHYDDKIDDIAKDWQLPRYELVKKVLNELKRNSYDRRTCNIRNSKDAERERDVYRYRISSAIRCTKVAA